MTGDDTASLARGLIRFVKCAGLSRILSAIWSTVSNMIYRAPILLLGLVLVDSALCCTIWPGRLALDSPITTAREYDAVFLARVRTSQRLSELTYIATVEVEKAWKGNPGSVIVVNNLVLDEATCTYPVVEGQEYIFFANADRRQYKAEVQVPGQERLQLAEMLDEYLSNPLTMIPGITSEFTCRNAGARGTVVVEYALSQTGEVIRSQVQESTDAGRYNEAAIETVAGFDWPARAGDYRTLVEFQCE